MGPLFSLNGPPALTPPKGRPEDLGRTSTLLPPHLLLQQLAVHEPRPAVGEAAGRVWLDVAAGEDALHVLVLSGLHGDVLEES